MSTNTLSGLNNFIVNNILIDGNPPKITTDFGILTLPSSSDTLVARSTTDTLTNKNFNTNNCIFVDNADNSKHLKILLNPATTGTTLFLQCQQTSNIIWSIQDSTDTFVGRATTDNLTNKTIQFTNGGSVLSYYQQSYTFSTTFTWGSFTSGSFTITLSRIGNIVQMFIPALLFTSTQNNTISTNTAMDSNFRPLSSIEVGFTSGTVSGVFNNFKVSISSGGIITIANASGSNNNINGTSAATNNASTHSWLYNL